MKNFYKKTPIFQKNVLSLQLVRKRSGFAMDVVAEELGSFGVAVNRLMNYRNSAGSLFSYTGPLIPQQQMK